jgi:hypothetical protein
MDIRAATRKAMKIRVRAVESREAARQHHARSIIGQPDAFLRVTETGYNLHEKDPDNLLPNR